MLGNLLVRSTLFVFQATKHPFYLNVGRDILHSLNNHTKVKCGYATVHNVDDKSLEDRQESFFLSETCKYLYLLFDIDNPINGKDSERYLFTTEGHIFPISSKIREKVWEDDFLAEENNVSVKDSVHYASRVFTVSSTEHSKLLKNGDSVYDARYSSNNVSRSKLDDWLPSKFIIPKCQSPGTDSPFRLPLKSKYLAQVFSQMEVNM